MSEAVSTDRGKVEIEGLVTSSAEEVKGFLKEGEELLKQSGVWKENSEMMWEEVGMPRGFFM